MKNTTSTTAPTPAKVKRHAVRLSSEEILILENLLAAHVKRQTEFWAYQSGISRCAHDAKGFAARKEKSLARVAKKETLRLKLLAAAK